MKNIVLARVDDRLIHTEILTLWVPEVRANRIIIVDDVVAKDKFRSKVIKEMAPQGLIIHVYGIDRATEKLKEAPSFDGERVIVIAESPLVFEELIKRGIKINQLNIGGMGIRGERKAVARRVACDAMEMEAIHELIKKHVHVYVILNVGHGRLVPYYDIIHDIGSGAFFRILFRFESGTAHFRDIHQITMITQQGQILICSGCLGTCTF